MKTNIFKFIEWAKQYGEDLSRYRFVFLDSLWNQLNQADKIKYFLLLSELNTEIVIEMGGVAKEQAGRNSCLYVYEEDEPKHTRREKHGINYQGNRIYQGRSL